jgi:hypothetical protein
LTSFWVSCATYAPPGTKPPASEVRIVGKIVEGAVPAFEPGEDPKKSYFIVTQSFVLYFYFLQSENKEQKMEIEKLRAIIEKK